MELQVRELIRRRTAELGMTRVGLVRRCGYVNVTKGLRHLDAVERGERHPLLLARLAGALEVETGALEEAFSQTGDLIRQQREAQEREAFQPHIYVMSEQRRPSWIVGAAVLGMRMKRLPVPAEILVLPLDMQIAQVAEMTRAHQQATGGECLFFGKITGYVFRRAFDERVVFDTGGNVMRHEHGRSMEDGVATAWIGNKRISFV